MSLHPSIAAKTQSRTSPWLIGGVGLGAFVIGGLATIGLMQLPTLLSGESNQQAMVIQTTPAATPEVTRTATPELLVVSEPAAAVATPEIVAETPVVSTSIPSATAALANPQPTVSTRSKEEAIAEAIAVANRNKMRMLTEGVVAGLYSVTVENDGENGGRIGLNSINAASAAAELERIISEGAAAGTLDVPEAATLGNGEVDSQTLLFDIVQRALEQGDSEEVAAAQELRRRAFAASGAETEVVSGKRYYVVESGDSLAYISLQFFGNTGAYQRIFDANRDILSSPNQIQIGQRLVIPST